jgi:two-component system, NarL family, invasion response regulator UvrY
MGGVVPETREDRESVRRRYAAVGVLTVDDDPRFLRLAREIVGATPGFETVGEAATGEAALSLIPVLRPQLVLMDVRMPGIGGIEAARRISERAGDRVAVVLMSADPHLLACAGTSRGTVGVVSKERLSPAALRALWTD